MSTPGDAISRRRVIDIDNHFYEAEDCFLRHIDPKNRDLAIVPKGDAGRRVWTMGDLPNTYLPPGFMLDHISLPGAAAAIFSGTKDFDFGQLMDAMGAMGDRPDIGSLLPAVHISDFPEWRDRQARLKLMDEQGLEAALMLPTFGMLIHFDLRNEGAALSANTRAFNRWVEEDWGFGADDRIFGVPILHLIDLDFAVEELERLAASGSRFVWIPHTPVNGKSPADPTFDPFWSRVEEFGIKPVFHLGFEGFSHLYGAHWGENPNRTVFEYSALQHFMCFSERPIVDTFAAVVLHNLFGRFPGIEILSVENGSVWVPSLLRSLDKAAKLGMGGEWLGGRLRDLPSEVFKNHVYVNPFHEEDVASLVEVVGAERVLFGSDYPHPEGLAEPLQNLPSIRAQVSEADAEKILFDNAASLLGLL